ncbi:sugar transferase [Marinitoga piezophila]|nr:sugar transferase [Marinitoga piezophila]
MESITQETDILTKNLEKKIVLRGIKKAILGTILAFSDLLILYFSFAIVSYLKYDGEFIRNLFYLKDIPSLYLISFIFILSFLFNKLYSFKTYLFWDEMKNIIKASFFSLIILLLFSFLNKVYYSRFVVIYGITLFVLLDMPFRYIYRKILYKLNIFKTNVLIIGAGEMGKIISDKIKAHTFTTYNIVGFLDDDEAKIGKKINDNYKVLGKTKDIDKILSQKNIDEIIIAIPTAKRETISKIISHLEGKVRRIKFIPDMYGLITFSTDIQDFDGVMTISASQGLLNPINRILKRVFDIIGGLIGGIFLIPLTIYVWIKIKLEDKGPVFFTQKRIGQNGKDIHILKFRSMIVDAEKVLFEMMEKDPKIKEEYLTHKKLKNDPRITKIGKFLRKTSLDEFPQFINVLKGNMSIVGPRPYLHREIPDMKESYYSIIKVKPGITGMWQVSGRNDLDFEERLKLDEYYVRNWSLWLDIIIILKTIKAVLDKKGAY